MKKYAFDEEKPWQIQPNSTLAYLIFITITLVVILVAPITTCYLISNFFEQASHSTDEIVRVSIYVMFLVIYLIYTCFNIYISFDSENKSGFVSIKLSENGIIMLGGRPIIVISASFPILLLAGIFKLERKTKEFIVTLDTFKVMTSTVAFAKEEGAKKYKDDILSEHRASHDLTFGSMFEIDGRYGAMMSLEKADSLEKIKEGHLFARKSAASVLAGETTISYIADNKEKFSQKFLKKIQDILGEKTKNEGYIGTKTTRGFVLDPVFSEAINKKLLGSIEMSIEKWIEVKEGTIAKNVAILKSEATAKGLELIGFAEANVKKAKLLADSIGYDKVAKALGMSTAVLKLIMDEAPEMLKFLQNADIRAVLMPGAGGGEGIIKEIVKVFTAISTVSDELKNLGGKKDDKKTE